MAPGALIPDSPPQAPHQNLKLPNNQAPTSIFPDGIRTSGQHPPVYSLLKPYSEFPKQIAGETAWQKEDFQANPEKWTHSFTEEEIEELGNAADKFIESGTELTGISKVLLPYLSPFL